MSPSLRRPSIIPDYRQSGLQPVPKPWRDFPLKGMLLDADTIRERIETLASEIQEETEDGPLLMIGILSGASVFMADLIRHMRGELEVTYIGVSSYRSGITSGSLAWTLPLQVDIKHRRVMIVDDILDTGRTLEMVTTHLESLGPASVKRCVLLQKHRESLHQEGDAPTIQAEHVGFLIPDTFVVGYGLDMDGQMRQLPFIGSVLLPES
jgi:hypoxanthine phosphoribosyltransferase